jgi:hypothetical protein
VANAVALAAMLGGCALGHPGSREAAAPSPISTYDIEVLAARPVLYLTMANTSSGHEPDRSGHGRGGLYQPNKHPPTTANLPNGDRAADFTGAGQYLEVPDSPMLSIPTTGMLTIEAWIRPDTLRFSQTEGSGYVYWLGKGRPRAQEYAMRMYSDINTEQPPRPNRISGYVFNLDGGLGSGAYVQDPVTSGTWIMIDLVIDTVHTNPAAPTGTVKIYKDGTLRGSQALTQFDIHPRRGSAPFEIATRNGASYFAGAIGKVAVYDTAGTPEQIQHRFQAMTRRSGP